jgi:DUF2892 family protein
VSRVRRTAPPLRSPTHPARRRRAAAAVVLSAVMATSLDPPWRNLAPWDRVLRVSVGVAMLAVGFREPVAGLGATLLLLFGWVPLVTGVAGWCPFYAVLGIRSRRR